MHRSTLLLVLGLAAACLADTSKSFKPSKPMEKSFEPLETEETRFQKALEERSLEEVNRRDGAHHGSHGATHHQSFGAPKKVSVSTSYSGPSSSVSSGSLYSAPVSNHLDSVSYSAPQTYSAPQKVQHHKPEKSVGYYYYYYPINAQKKEKSIYGKMKKFFEPIWYPWDTMMYYMGYHQDESDYEYDSYASTHYRSAANRVSDYMPWEAIEEVGNVVTQDQCIEFYMCQMGSYARDYTNVHFLVDIIAPHIANNSYYTSLADSMVENKDCFDWSCPVIKRMPVENDL